jgi:hypothetical protein
MRNVARILAGIAAVGVAVLVGRLDAAQPAPKTADCPFCGNPQSPRKVTPETRWNWESTVPMVSPEQKTPDTIDYSPRAGVKVPMHPCSQHYHCLVENFQGCTGQEESNGRRSCPDLKPGNWVEIHTAYHMAPAVHPLPEDLGQCDTKDGKPVVVVGYHAMVTSSPAVPSLPLHFGPPAAEWSGSSTNNENDQPASCKIPAFWHFALGCGFKVSAEQLRHMHPETARALQSSDRLSHDLTHIEAPKKPR